MANTPAHEVRESLRVDVVYPEHIERGTASSAEFDHNRHVLINKRGLRCAKCDAKDALEAHHRYIEWSEWESADPAKVLKLIHMHDHYGDAALLGDAPVQSPDDIRNLIILCATCHRGAGLGIHQVPEPFFFADWVKKDGATVLKSLNKGNEK
jgi:hypothetical protein